MDLKEQRRLHYEPACQNDIKKGDRDFGSDHRARSHPAKFIVCTYKCRQIPELF